MFGVRELARGLDYVRANATTSTDAYTLALAANALAALIAHALIRAKRRRPWW